MRAGAALGALLALLAFPVAHGGRGDTFAASLARIEVTAVPSRYVVPHHPRGRVGDFERLHWAIHDRFGRSIGTGLFSCWWVVYQGRLCSGEVQLPLGKVTMIGSSPTRDVGVFSVVGGTGRYVGARGEVTFKAIGVRKLVVALSV